jgi:hypothetical protein
MAKKKQTKAEKAETEGRLMAFNEEMDALAKKYQVKLDINQRIVVVDNKPKASQ